MRIVSDPRLFIFISILGSQNFDTESIPEVQNTCDSELKMG